jgi:LCP family protein required for cell wall assembly
MSSSFRSLRALSVRFGIALLVTTLVAVAGLAYLNYRVNADIANIPRIEVKTDKALGPGKPANYLIIGSDTRSFVADSSEKQAFGNPNDQTGQRSDTMMILHVEPQAKRTLIVSIPRDTWVNIPGVGQSKINAAFNKDLGGGPDKVIETIKSNFNIPIQHYVEVDFSSFQGIVDALGSIPVYFPYPARDEVTGLNIPTAGCQQLKGDMALAYVRSRHYEEKVNGRWRSDPTADLGRIKRQQDFMRRVGGEAIKGGISNPLTARTLLDKTLKKLTVDPSFDQQDVYRLINSFRDVDPNDTERIRTETLPGEGAMRSGQSVIVVKQPEADAMLAELRTFNDTPTPKPAAVAPSAVQVRVVNGSGQTGVAATALASLQSAGFGGAGTGNNSIRVARTEVRFAPGNEAKAALVASYFGGTAVEKSDPSVAGADVEVILGQNFKGVSAPTSTTTAATPAAPAASAPGGVASPPPGDPSAC